MKIIYACVLTMVDKHVQGQLKLLRLSSVIKLELHVMYSLLDNLVAHLVFNLTFQVYINERLSAESVGWACVTHLSFCFEETLYRTFHRLYYLILVNLAKQFQRRFFRNRPFRNKNCLWRSCLLTNRDEISNLYGGPSIDPSYQVLVHLAKRFQRRRFKNIGQSETRNACSGHVC